VGPWGGTPWPGVPAFVVTHRTREDLPGGNGGTFAFDGVQGAPLFAGERAELVPLGKPVAGTVTHLRYRVAKP
jgi:hypothetical protein